MVTKAIYTSPDDAVLVLADLLLPQSNLPFDNPFPELKSAEIYFACLCYLPRP